ncbi:MAG: hypothetical protein U0359_24120 [Byssovorax sp.]
MRIRWMKPVIVSVLTAFGALAGCEGSDPGTTTTTTSSTTTTTTSSTTTTTTTTTTGTGGSGTGGSGTGGTGGMVVVDPCETYGVVTPMDGAACPHAATDFDPTNAANDGWAACVSDDNMYHPFDPNVSSNLRTIAFDDIGKLLGFGTVSAPDSKAFLDAQLVYLQAEGIESRVSRREDEHYAKAAKACNMMTPEELAMNVDRCVGPAQIQPLINKAFEDGIAGVDPGANAARIEAALLWFFYVSAHKEPHSCAKTQGDCDSATGYYAGTQKRDEALGLAKYVKAHSPQAHDRIWDGFLAVRCWRDLDNPAGAAADLVMRDKAIAQLDKALLRGMALILRQKVEHIGCNPAWVGAKILGHVLDREATARDAAKAQIIRDELAKANAADVDAKKVIDAIDAVFPCP